MEFDYGSRMARLTARKIAQTIEKQRVLGARDEDDYGLVLPPASFKVDLPVRDATGQWSGPRAWAANFRWLMENHPCYIDPDDAIAGRWMFMLSRMRLGYQLSRSNFAFDYSHLEPLQKKYDITTGRILNHEIHETRENNSVSSVPQCEDNYAIQLLDAEEQAILGVIAWTRRLAAAADDRAMAEDEPDRRANLREMARVCYRIAEAPPATFREVCQWIAIFNMASRTYNRDGAGGQLDELLRPYWERDKAAGILTDEDAEFYVFCLFLNDPHYYQIGGPDADGRDQTSPLSYIILEAAGKLKASCNLTIRVLGAESKYSSPTARVARASPATRRS